MLLKKLFSKKAQISMEIGILIAASIVVATIASYYYIKNYKDTYPENVGKSAKNVNGKLGNVSKKFTDLMST